MGMHIVGDGAGGGESGRLTGFLLKHEGDVGMAANWREATNRAMDISDELAQQLADYEAVLRWYAIDLPFRLEADKGQRARDVLAKYSR